MDAHFDVIIIGTGAGGGTVAYKLADSGKNILVLERGDYIPQEKENWSTEEVFIKKKYTTTDRWLNKEDKEFRPQEHYNVGGDTKLYGAALFRLRECDFGEIKHYGGISPAWPIDYSDLRDYYQEAEELYNAHGKRGVDPSEPPEERPYPHDPIPNPPRIQEVVDDLTAFGLHPFPLPLGVNPDTKPASAPFVLDRFDGYPDPTEHKGDAHVNALRKALMHDNVQLWTNCKADKLLTNEKGDEITGVEFVQDNETKTVTADLVIVSCGAINSAILLLKSANEKHPNGLANGSGVVGRHYMFHNNSAMMAVSKEPNPTKFGKTFGVNDYYRASKDQEFPFGGIQMLGKSDELQIKADSPVPAPGFTFEWMAEHAVDFWLCSEDLPDPNNRVVWTGNQIKIIHTKNNMKAHKKLTETFEHALNHSGKFHHIWTRDIFLSKEMPLAATAHKNGTVRFGTDRNTSALDTFCRAHEVKNLFVVDGSFYVSAGAVNPGLTIMAMALRVGYYIKNEIL